jgi:cell division septum initiation protein DivIVA
MLDIAYAAGCCSLTATSRESVSIMSENTAEATAEATELTSHYSAQVAGDLERNLKEQQRLSDEIDALQTQLAALRHDHSVLVNIQQALGVSSEPAAPSAEQAPAPAGRKQAKSATRTRKQVAAKKPATAGRKSAESKATASKTTESKATEKPAATSSARPKLVDLVRDHLAGLSEPRSAAEVTTTLAQQHPDRTIKTTVVRTTLEGLVAKNRAQRSKQGKSVYYTAPETAEATASAEQ